MNAPRFEQIETQIAFLERANAELSEAVLHQHRQIEILRTQLAGLVARIEAMSTEARERTPEEERPPHY
jgi:uncharacterized coiled-coil protein SlyX